MALRNYVRVQNERDSWVAVSELCSHRSDARSPIDQGCGNTVPETDAIRGRDKCAAPVYQVAMRDLMPPAPKFEAKALAWEAARK